MTKAIQTLIWRSCHSSYCPEEYGDKEGPRCTCGLTQAIAEVKGAAVGHKGLWYPIENAPTTTMVFGSASRFILDEDGVKVNA